MAPRMPSLRHGAVELLGGALGRLHRQRRDPHEAVRMRLHELGDLVVLQRGGATVKRGVLVVEIGLRRRREHMHVDLGRVHVLEAALELPAAARERPVGRAGDLQHREIVRRSGSSFGATQGASLARSPMVSSVRMWV